VNFRNRLALFLIATLIVVQALTAVFTYGTIRSSLVESGKRQLSTATTALMKQLGVLGDRVGDDVEVLSLDYALRKAVAEHDQATALSALRNHGNRIGATRMMLLALDGTVSADTGGRYAAGTAFPFPKLIESAASQDQATTLAVLDGKLYWIVAVPVRAPVPIAFIAACVPVDNALLDRLAQLSSMPQSMALVARTDNGWAVVAETSGYSPGQLPWQDALNAQGPVLAGGENAGHMAMMARLATEIGSSPALAVFDYPLDQMLNSYRAVLKPMLLVLIGALVLGLAATVLIARGVSRPLELLASAARRIAHGDYAPIPPLGRSDEISELASALNGMTRSVAEREAALTKAVVSMEAARTEAVKANEAKSQFLSNMSHELRTPLNAIIGFSEIIHGQMLGPIGVARYAEYARHILQSGAHLATQFEQMLDLAQAESGKLALARKRFAPGHVVDRCVRSFSSTAEKAGVMLAIEGDFAGWPEMDGDEGKLERSFANLIDNAIKFSRPGGIVTIRGMRGRDIVKLVIADRGTGIRPEDLAMVIRPFHRGRRAFDGMHQGAGLGLPFAKSIIELHQGSLVIESEPGAGTTVTVCLPIALASELSHAA
jgi:signal transduction histidine kinase